MKELNEVVSVWPGRSYPLGATWNGEGVNFALFSEHAEKVELCLFSSDARHEIARVPLHWQTDQVWHTFLPEARPGLLYGYRVHGPYRPREGHRFNPHKLLLDPYAREIVGLLLWNVFDVEDIKDIVWFNLGGQEITAEEWKQPSVRCLGMLVAGGGLNEYDDQGRVIKDVNFLLLFNAGHESVSFALPTFMPEATWILEFDTTRGAGLERGGRYSAGQSYDLAGRSLALLREDVRQREAAMDRMDSSSCAPGTAG